MGKIWYAIAGLGVALVGFLILTEPDEEEESPDEREVRDLYPEADGSPRRRRATRVMKLKTVSRELRRKYPG